MSNPIPLQDEFTGMFRDKSRDRLPRGKVWNLQDYIPDELGAPLCKRGGWPYHGVTLNSLNASAGQPDRVAFVPFTTGLQVIAVDSSIPRLFDLTNGVDRGSVNKPVGPMVFYRDKLIIPCDIAGANPQKYTGGAPAALTGAPDFAFAAVYKDRLAAISQGASGANTIKRVYYLENFGDIGFTLTFQGQTTSTLTEDSTAAEVQTALENLSNIAPGDVTVTDQGGATILDVHIEFKGAYATQNVGLTGTELANPPDSILQITTIQAGSAFSTSPRINFSGAGNPESWDTTNRYLDTSGNLVALAALPNALLAFHSGTVERIRGGIPPGSAAANMELEPLFSDIGLIGNDAVSVAEGNCYWADENGVYRTDGSGSPIDLTKQGGISSYWREQAARASGSVSLAVWRGYVWISLLDASDTYVDFLVFDIDKRAWLRFTNIRGYNFATQYGATDELYFSNRDTASKQIGALGGVFSPSLANKNDADGDAVAPVVETGIYPIEGQGKKRVKHIYVSYDERDAASDNPALTVSYLTDPASSSYTALSPTLPETTGRDRKRRALGSVPAYGYAFKIAQANASSDTRLYALEADVGLHEASRR